MTTTNLTPYPQITPGRLRAASRLLRDLRAKGCKFKLDSDERGFRVRRPSDMPVGDYNAEFDDVVIELRDEVIELLRQEKRGDLAIDE